MSISRATENVLQKVSNDEEVSLTEEEIRQVKDFLSTIKTLGRIGKVILWLIITAATVTAALHNLKIEWLAGS